MMIDDLKKIYFQHSNKWDATSEICTTAWLQTE